MDVCAYRNFQQKLSERSIIEQGVTMGRGRGSIDVRRLAVRPLAHPHSRGWVTPSTLFDVDPSVLKIIQSHAIKTSPGDVALSASMSPGGAHIMVVPNGTIYEIRDTDHTTVMKEILTAIGRYPKLQQSSTIDSFHRHYLELGRRIHREGWFMSYDRCGNSYMV
jgi:hypothetical protein